MIERDFADLAGKRVLIVEDDYLIAADMEMAVEKAGCIVAGPVSDVNGALAIIEHQTVHAAILDIRLGDETAFPIARTLQEQGVPVVFVTGYDDWFIPSDLDEIPIHRKPADPENVIRVVFGAAKDRID